MNIPDFLQLSIKNFDGHIAGAKLSGGQARQIIEYAKRIGVQVHQHEPVPMIDSHNAITSYHAGTNPGD